MGMEYALRFAHQDAAAVVKALKRLTVVRQLTSDGVDLELRRADATGEMPDAWMRVESFGLYFCDNGGGWSLGKVIALLVADFGPVTVEELA